MTKGGWCYRSGFHDLYWQSKLVAIDEQADHNIMHRQRLGKADCLAYQPLEAGAQCEMFAPNLLRVALTRTVDCRGEIPFVSAPIICIVACDAKGIEQRLELQKHFILTPTKDIGQDLSGAVIKGLPEPAWLFLLPHKTPHFINFSFIYALKADHDVVWV